MVEVVEAPHQLESPLRLLFIHEVNWMKKVVYEIHDFPELLSLRGHDVTFIDYPEGVKGYGLIDLKTRRQAHLTRAHEGSEVTVVTPGRGLPPPLDRFTSTLTQWREIRHHLLHGMYDCVILYGVPTNGWQTIMTAKKAGVPVLFRAIDISHQLRKTRLGPVIKIAEDYIYRNATAISCHNEPLRQYCIGAGARAERVSVEYPGLDLVRFAPGARNPELALRWGIEPRHRVAMFMGTLYRFSGLDWFLKEFAEALRQKEDYRVLILGGGEDEEKLRSLTCDLGIERQVIFTGFINYQELPDYLRLADVAFNSFQPTPVTECALPGKVLQYLGCGLASVCTPLAGLRSMLSEGRGILYRSLDHEFIVTVSELLADDQRRAAIGRQGRSTMEELCAWENSISKFEHAVRRTINYHAGAREASNGTA